MKHTEIVEPLCGGDVQIAVELETKRNADNELPKRQTAEDKLLKNWP